ncbi:MAG: MogA/MoaB family molybdenum cofactor biosynthesis protein [Dehalococcoidia bacterium]
MITVGILTISDAVSRGKRRDTSGDNIERLVGRLDARVDLREVVPDERDQIAARMIDWADRRRIDLILTTGGTGLAPRDVTPEATREVIDREAPGLAEMMRLESAKSNIHAILSRGVAGARGRCLIINLPGSPQGVEETLELVLPVLPHAIAILKGKQADHTPPSHAHGPEPHHH